MKKKLPENYYSITKNLLNYLPSRGLIILNFLVIIPLFTHILDKKEMSIYIVAIQILNLILTCSFDWVSKSVLRFYEKFRLKNCLEKFFSSVFWISIIVYLITVIVYFLLKNVLIKHFAISETVFLYTLFLVVPCGIRQFLYQILRLKNNYKLYTFSIAIYEIAFVVLFFSFINFIPGSESILLAMNIAITFIDLIIFRMISFDYKLSFCIDISIVREILKYALPLVVTNACYWGVFNFSKLIFQSEGLYSHTAIIGVSLSAAEYIVNPLVALFIFVTFPFIIQRFENKDGLKPYFTNIIQLFYMVLAPLIAVFCLFSREITLLVLPNSYEKVALALPFVAAACFIHEFLKFVNLKYHMKNRTYIETRIGFCVISFSIFLNLVLIKYFSILGAAIAMLVTELVLLMTNVSSLRKFDYISWKPFLKTFIKTTFLILCSFAVVSVILPFENKFVYLFKIVVYLILVYIAGYKLRGRFLKS